MYVDARLHISVRPVLEYRLPDAARAARTALLGDRAAHEGPARARVLPRAPPRPRRRHRRLAPTRRCSSSARGVYTHSHDYLHALASEWRKHLQHVADEVHRAAQATRRGVREADAVRRAVRRSGRRGPSSRSTARSVARLSRALDTGLDAVRAAPAPSCARPEALSRAADELKDAFSAAYGRAPTAELMAVKAHFETEMARVEHLVAEDFVRCVALLLQ